MSDIPFYMTRMGRRFYEHTVPALVEQLARLNERLDRLVALQEQRQPGDEEPPCRT